MKTFIKSYFWPIILITIVITLLFVVKSSQKAVAPKTLGANDDSSLVKEPKKFTPSVNATDEPSGPASTNTSNVIEMKVQNPSPAKQ